jgi:hypothetical protein
MAHLPIQHGRYTIILDDMDHARVAAHSWCRDGQGYVVGRVAGRVVQLHRFLLDAPAAAKIIHRNDDRLDFQRNNLAVVTHGQALQRQKKRPGSSRYRGVHFHRQAGRWRASITHQGKHIYLGYFDEEAEGALAYDQAALRYHGPTARLNFPPG